MVLTPDMSADEMFEALEKNRQSERFKNLPKNIQFEDKGDSSDVLDEIKDIPYEELEKALDDDDKEFWGPLYGLAKWVGVI